MKVDPLMLIKKDDSATDPHGQKIFLLYRFVFSVCERP
jgi:hypothetical protein